MWTDAVRFLAHALPRREAVWWACTCARLALPASAAPEVGAALQAAEAWVFQPTEENRRAAMEKAEAAGFDTPSAWSAVSVFWSGGSMAPEGMPDAPPDPSLYAIGVGASVLLAIAAGEPQSAERRFEEAIERGIDIANGGNGKLKAELHREAS
jgi:hypothetical protein